MAPHERSPNTELWKAVHAFQAEAPALQRDKINPAFKSKYLSLDSLMEQVMPLLNKHGLVWVTVPNFQTVSAGGEARIEPNLAYRLIHAESGQETKGTVPLILGKRDMQGLGSAVTYGRRYALMCVLGLVADEDDDGNKASRPARSAAPAQRPRNGNGLMSAEATGKLIAHVNAHDGNIDLLLGAVGAESTDDLTVEQGKQIWKLVTA